MVPYTKVIAGIDKFLDEEIISKLASTQKWVIGTGAKIMLNNATNIFNELKNHTFVKSLGIINEKDEIDVGLIYKELKKQAQKGAMTIDVPLAGTLTLTEQDVDKLYNFIIGG